MIAIYKLLHCIHPETTHLENKSTDFHFTNSKNEISLTQAMQLIWSPEARSDIWWAGKHAMYSHWYSFESGSQLQHMSCSIPFHPPVILYCEQSEFMKIA